MPPEMQNPVAESRRGHSFLWIFLGILLGIALVLGGEYALFRAGMLQNSFQNYFLAHLSTQIPVVPAQQEAPVDLSSFLLSSTTIAVPKAYANQAYFEAINSVFFDINTSISVGSQIPTLFTQISTQVSSGNYAGIFDLIVRVKTLVAQEKSTNAQLAVHLNALAAANQKTTDAVTKSLTQDVLAKGTALQSALGIFFNNLDGFFSGAIPTQAQISETTALSKSAGTALADFHSSLQPLLDHFKAAATAR